MGVTSLGANKTVVTKADGTQIFYSYSTPVAAHIPGTGYVRTDQHYSATTSRHINEWAGKNAKTVSQAYLNDLA